MPEKQRLSRFVTWDSSWGVTGVKIGDFDHCHCPSMANSHGTDVARIECALCSLRDENQRLFSFALSYAS